MFPVVCNGSIPYMPGNTGGQRICPLYGKSEFYNTAGDQSTSRACVAYKSIYNSNISQQSAHVFTCGYGLLYM